MHYGIGAHFGNLFLIKSTKYILLSVIWKLENGFISHKMRLLVPLVEITLGLFFTVVK